ncbi:uncharacterized protein LOC132262463 [Phlebotomus argentipes]|uniref:uncharacterized protein LOC132262463 n=1 Tax=Phlebotomus argentipes TaxID=94469 RepID=UPI002893060F|nr:uncharacterized protein LOC132262463 [Phlebotomus argentipes]
MRIRQIRGVPKWQVMLTIAVGVIGGTYIYRPLIIKYHQQSQAPGSLGENSAATSSNTPQVKMAPRKAPGIFTGLFGITCVTVLICMSYKIFIQPYTHTKRLREAEEYAEYIYRREQAAKSQSHE